MHALQYVVCEMAAILFRPQCVNMYSPWDPFHKQNMSSSFKSHEYYLVPIQILMIQSGHNFAHATTPQMSWHVQNCGLIISLFFIQELHVYFLQDLDYELISSLWNRCLDCGDIPCMDCAIILGPWAVLMRVWGFLVWILGTTLHMVNVMIDCTLQQSSH